MTATSWLDVARAQAALDLREDSRPGHHNWEIVKFFKATTYRATRDEVPWCAAFACWCLEEAGVGSTRSARARDFLTWGVRIDYPPIGALVVLKRGGGNQPGRDVIDAPGHVGFLVESPTPAEVMLLGGNQGNALNVRPYPVEQVLDYRWAA